MNIKKKIHIVQNVIPSYRKDFFELLKTDLYDVKIFTSKKNELGLNGVALTNTSYFDELGLFNVNKFMMYQNWLPIFSGMKSGDILVLSGNPRILSNYFIIFWAKIKGITLVCWSHGWTAGSYGLNSKIRINLLNFYNAVLLYTEREAEKLLNLNNISKPVFFLNNGINYNIVKEHCEKVSKFININDRYKTNRFIFCGRLTKKSNIMLLIDCFISLGDDYELLIVGDGELLESCSNYIAEHSVNNITLLGSIYNPELLAKYYLSCQAFIYPGSVGLSLIHAMAHGVPAIIHDDEKYQMPEYSASNIENSVYFKKDDINSLNRAIKHFKSLDLDLKKRMSLASISIVRDKYNTEKMAENFFNMVDSL